MPTFSLALITAAFAIGIADAGADIPIAAKANPSKTIFFMVALPLFSVSKTKRENNRIVHIYNANSRGTDHVSATDRFALRKL